MLGEVVDCYRTVIFIEHLLVSCVEPTFNSSQTIHRIEREQIEVHFAVETDETTRAEIDHTSTGNSNRVQI